jgi:hypothetical protein
MGQQSRGRAILAGYVRGLNIVAYVTLKLMAGSGVASQAGGEFAEQSIEQ